MQSASRAARTRDSVANVSTRHCERSEAIHSFIARQCGLLRFACNDVAKPRRTGCLAFAAYDETHDEERAFARLEPRGPDVAVTV
jgi:hypothetical protein